MLLLVTTIATVAVSQGAEAGVYEEFTGVRSTSMGGTHRGVGTSNDTLYLNPAGMAVASRYSLDAAYAYSGFDELNRFNASIVDSKSGPVAGGIGYTLIQGDSSGLDARVSRFNGALAYALGDALAVGLTLRHVRGALSDQRDEDGARVRRDVRLWNGDIGISAQLGSLGLGFVYQNALSADDDEEAFAPRTVAGGFSYTSGSLVLAGDLTAEIDDDDDAEFGFQTGAEYFLQNTYAFRFGYRYEPFVRGDGREDEESILSGGAGYITGDGAIDLGFFRSLDRSQNWSLLASVRVFI